MYYRKGHNNSLKKEKEGFKKRLKKLTTINKNYYDISVQNELIFTHGSILDRKRKNTFREKRPLTVTCALNKIIILYYL